jgi:hypothetical protein
VLHQGATFHRVFRVDGYLWIGDTVQAYPEGTITEKIGGENTMLDNDGKNNNGNLRGRFLPRLKPGFSSANAMKRVEEQTKKYGTRTTTYTGGYKGSPSSSYSQGTRTKTTRDDLLMDFEMCIASRPKNADLISREEELKLVEEEYIDKRRREGTYPY